MTERILIDAVHPEEIRVAVANDSRLEEFDFETTSKKQIKSNIYLGKVTRIEPSLQAAFVEYGGNKQGFLPFSEVHYDYYQIPVSDKEKIAAELASANEAEIIEKPAENKEENKTESKTEKTKKETSETEKKDDETPAPAETSPAAEGENLEPAEEEGVETVGDDITSEVRSKRRNLFRNYKIQEVLKRNQIVLVQVIKEERGNKGASLTTYISLAGRYCVLMPNTDRQGGVSRRISDMGERRKLKEIISGLEMPKGTSIIVRTAGTDRSKEEIKRDFDYLLNLWNDIRKRTVDSKAPALIYGEGNIIKRSIRDLYRDNISEILIEGNDGLKEAKDFLETMAPDHVSKIKEYKESEPIFQYYKIDSQLDELYENSARLKSGGSIVITPTEALVSIDVNSGKSTRSRSIEETALKTNTEAAVEIARQLRLRDLAGLVVIDFIDMRELRNRRAVERELKEALKADRAKIQVGRISPFGLLEMSRQRMRSSLVEASTSTCPICKGRGTVRSSESTSVRLLRAIESEAAKGKSQEIRLRTSSEASFYLLNNKRNEVIAIEKQFGVKVFIDHDHNIVGSEFTIDRPSGRNRKGRRNERPDYSDKRKGGYEKNNNEKKPVPYKSNTPASTTAPANTAEESGNKVEEEKVEDDNIGNKVENNNSYSSRRPQRGRKKPRKFHKKHDAGQSRVYEGQQPRADTKNDSPEADGDNSSKLKGLWKKITT